MSDNGGPSPIAEAATNKPKRVRTGCLTCRERHLKCDEGQPTCLNCRKSSRICKRGIRLNFIDTTVQAPPIVAGSQEWVVSFLDESRDIASEYKGGLSKYGASEGLATARIMSKPFTHLSRGSQHLDSQRRPSPHPNLHNPMAFDFSVGASSAPAQHQPLPSIQMLGEAIPDDNRNLLFDPPQESDHPSGHSHTNSTYSSSNVPATSLSSYTNQDVDALSPRETRDYLTSQEEVLFMQVFVEEVGLWMDSMDPQKHFSRLLPFHALGEPMLLNAFLACGARHLSLVNPKYTEDKALHYYDTATRYLLNSLQNPNRDTVICATTAVILNVYEIMCEKALQRMNHIAGARALIKECGWNARSSGIGAACFWLNVGMELLSCLHFNWQVAWDPDEWGVDMDFARETESGREEVWTYRIIYVTAKICNFRASIPRYQADSPRDEQIRLQTRYNEWKRLKEWADAWNENVPRTMHPLGYLYPFQTVSQSAFPEVWLIKRSTIVARLFYHTAMVLLAQTNPVIPAESDEMRNLQTTHATQICGIVAHVKDRGVASVALRSLAIAAECLTSRREQEEVLRIFEKIRQETGWRVGFMNKELKEKWGWRENSPAQPGPVAAAAPQNSAPHTFQPATVHPPQVTLQHQPANTLPAPVPAARPRPMPGMLNPLLATADFSMPQHPYQSHYVAPNSGAAQHQLPY